MSPLLERFAVEAVDGRTTAWVVRLDGVRLLHLTENHLAVNDLRASNQFNRGFALLRNPWIDAPRLEEHDGAVHLFGGDTRVGIMRWHPERPAHVEVVVFDLKDRLLDLEVRYRQLPAPGVVHEPAAPGLGP